MSANVDLNQRSDYDAVLQDIADYVLDYRIDSAKALDIAHNCLMDTLGYNLLALRFPECTKHFGPLAESIPVPYGARVPGTSFRLDPVKAAWDIGCIVRRLDYNGTWLAAEWGHPSDNLGGILVVADHPSQKRLTNDEAPLSTRQVPEAMIMVHEIRGVIVLENSFNRVGLDHVLLVEVASTAVCAKLMGVDREQLLAVLSHAFVDGQAPRTYRHASNADSCKSWVAGDATSRGVRLADTALRGEMGILGVFSAPQWGFYDALLSHTSKDPAAKPEDKRRFNFPQGYGSYVMENAPFRISFPAEFHVQTAAEAAIRLHPLVKDRLQQISRITITTHESAIHTISKVGPLANLADHDHYLQYMVVVPLIFGDLATERYEDAFHAAHPLIDRPREKMEVVEEPRYSHEYPEAGKCSIANAAKVFFDDGSSTGQVVMEYPPGHRCRRAEGIPLPQEKLETDLATRFPPQRCQRTFDLRSHQASLEATSVNRFVNLLTIWARLPGRRWVAGRGPGGT